jgi:diaminobutyrate-2-oxoglutarate transaminase
MSLQDADRPHHTSSGHRSSDHTSSDHSEPTARGAAVGATTGSGAADREVFERRESAVRSYCRGFDHVLTRANGSLLHDVDGRQYIDFLAGAGSLNYGHNHPVLKSALLEYIEQDGIAHSLDLYTTAKQAFLETFERLVLAPRGMPHRVQFTGPTGTNAIEAALKLARSVTGRQTVIAFTNGFHGVSLGSLAVTSNRAMRMAPIQPLPGVARLPYDGYLGDGVDTSMLLERMLDDPSSGLDAPAAILLESVQGEGGLAAASPRWLRRIAELARRHEALLILDDIQAGCGRTGSFFSHEPSGIQPDLIALSKSLSGYGLPLAVLLLRPEIDLWQPGQHNGTFRGNTHAFVTARAALETFWTTPDLMVDVARRANMIASRLADLADRVPGAQLRGRGMMLGLDVVDPALASTIRRSCADGGLLLETCGPRDEVVKVLAPLNTPDDLLARGLDILVDAVHAATGHLSLTGDDVHQAVGIADAGR